MIPLQLLQPIGVGNFTIGRNTGNTSIELHEAWRKRVGQGRNVYSAMHAALTCLLAWKEQGMAVHTFPVTRTNIVPAMVLITWNVATHTVISVGERIGTMDRGVFNVVQVGIEPYVIIGIVSDSVL